MRKALMILLVLLATCALLLGYARLSRRAKTDALVARIPPNVPADVRRQIRKLCSASPGRRAAAAEDLAKMGDRAVPAIPFLIETLSDHSGLISRPSNYITTLSDEAAIALAEIGYEALGPLLDALRNDDWRTRAGAAMALGRMRDPRAVDPLIVALEDESESVREEAARSLRLAFSMYRNLELWPWPPRMPIVPYSTAYDDPYAVKAAREAFAAALRDESFLVRECAAEALGEIGDRTVVEPLTDALYDESPLVRCAAAEALGSIGDDRAVYWLIRVLQGDSSSEVRGRALKALRGITGQKFGRQKDDWWTWWENHKEESGDARR
ncbi:MAG: HEAT repeat domain-containing protein [Armatimonadota bacterium]|nr:MAG: HEAT repeat domain-containing protein [Armatimonadota bacterium]